MEIRYIERSTGQVCVEAVFGRRALEVLYGWGRFLTPLVARIPWVSRLVGAWQKRPASRKNIAPFVQTYQVHAEEFAETSFSSFNDFFIRKLKPEARPIIADPNRAALPADGRYRVFPDAGLDALEVKGRTFDWETFLGDATLAKHYRTGSCAMARLCPSDYHRFHFPCDGRALEARPIPGALFSVNPMALLRRPSILWENKRMITPLESPHFGTLLLIEVGATCVGSIHQTYRPGPIRKGDEKGYFSFGGSMLVLLFEPGRIAFDADLIAHTSRGLETRANFGGSLGTYST